MGWCFVECDTRGKLCPCPKVEGRRVETARCSSDPGTDSKGSICNNLDLWGHLVPEGPDTAAKQEEGLKGEASVKGLTYKLRSSQ